MELVSIFMNRDEMTYEEAEEDMRLLFKVIVSIAVRASGQNKQAILDEVMAYWSSQQQTN